MRVSLFLPHLGVSGGLGVHCRGVVAALLEVSPADDRFDVFAPADPGQLFPLAGPDDGCKRLAADPRVTVHPLDWPAGRTLADPLDPVLLGPVTAARPDVVYCSYYTGLERPPARQAVTFHDAGFLDFPEGFGDTAAKRRAAFERCRPAVDKLLCVSADARDRICAKLPFDPARTAVIWHALPDTPDEITKAADGFPADAPLWPGGDRIADWGAYFFTPVGAATGFNRGRKNVPTAVTAFRTLAADATLVIAGTGVVHDGMLSQLLPADELANGAKAGDGWVAGDGRVRVVPNLARRPFLAALGRARAVVYPSRYEGFGLPAVEAMAVGVPLIAGAATSLPEVVGDGGLLVDPDDVSGFAAAMARVLSDPGSLADVVARGRRRAATFTLRRMGSEMRAALADVANGG